MFWIGFIVGLVVGLIPLVLLVWKGITMMQGKKEITQEELVTKVVSKGDDSE